MLIQTQRRRLHPPDCQRDHAARGLRRPARHAQADGHRRRRRGAGLLGRRARRWPRLQRPGKLAALPGAQVGGGRRA